jgi:hypothetical protein
MVMQRGTSEELNLQFCGKKEKDMYVIWRYGGKYQET